MIKLIIGQPGSGMTLSFCGPSDINGAGPVMTAPPVPGPGVRIFDKKRERANRLKKAARARRVRDDRLSRGGY